MLSFSAKVIPASERVSSADEVASASARYVQTPSASTSPTGNQDREWCTGADDLAFTTHDAVDPGVAWCGHMVFHLHGLDRDDRLARLHVVSRASVHAPPPTPQRRRRP